MIAKNKPIQYDLVGVCPESNSRLLQLPVCSTMTEIIQITFTEDGSRRKRNIIYKLVKIKVITFYEVFTRGKSAHELNFTAWAMLEAFFCPEPSRAKPKLGWKNGAWLELLDRPFRIEPSWLSLLFFSPWNSIFLNGSCAVAFERQLKIDSFNVPALFPNSKT